MMSSVLVTAYLAIAAAGGSVAADRAQPPPAAALPSTAPATAGLPPTLAGSLSCRECHEPFYAKWETSHHGLAMQPFAAHIAARLKPLAEPLTVRNRRYRAEFASGNGWIVENGPAGERKYAIQHTLGGKNVYYFLTLLERGRLQVLPVAYDVRRQEWFDTTGSAARGLMHFEDEVLDWRAPQLTFNTSCHGCHVSQFSSNYDPQTDTYHSVWAEPGINCETCHAAGAEHVRLFRDLPADQQPSNIRIISTKSFTVQQTNALCAPCHAKAAVLTDGFRPGERFFDNYDLVALEDSDFYPDGRDLGENYTYTAWRMSPCAKSGKLSCVHCHTSSGRYRFVDNTNQACLPCHPKHVSDPAAHTHHTADGPTGRCVVCHMPMSEFARMRRSDHSMRPPMPAATLTFNSPNACNQCHTEQSAEWADYYVRQWRTRDYQAPTLQAAALVDAARKHDWTRLPDMLAYTVSGEREEIFAVGLIRLLRACADERKWPALLKALKDASPLVRASAAEGLDGYLTPESVAALLAATADEYRLVRVRAAASLAAHPSDALPDKPRRDLERATGELLAISRARPDDSASHHNLGNFHAARREYDKALACYERAVQLLPDNIAPLVNASLVQNALGRNDQAEASLRRALQVEPGSAAANLNLGLLLGELGRLPEAEAVLRRAFEADAQSATAAYNLAVICGQTSLNEGIEWCRKAAQIEPDEPKYTHALAFYLRRLGDAEEAIATLRTLTDRDVAFADAYTLLGQIYEEARRMAEAAELYRRAAANPRFPNGLRQQFAARATRLNPAP